MNSLASWACVMTLMVAARSNGVCASEREECIQTRLRSFHGYEYRKTLSDLKVAHGGPITSMTLIKEDPLLEFKGRCIKGYSFDNQYSRLYVRHGCQGDFSVCYKNKVCETKKLKSGVKGLIKFYYAPKGKNYTSISLTKETGIGPDGDLSKISKCRDPTRKLIPTENGDAFGVGNNKKQVFIFNHCSGTFRVCYTRPPLASKEREECIQRHLRSFHGLEYRQTLADLKVPHGGPIINMTLIKEDPLLEFKSRCRKGYSFDNQYSRVWVRHGCQGDFSVCHKNKEMDETHSLVETYVQKKLDALERKLMTEIDENSALKSQVSDLSNEVKKLREEFKEGDKKLGDEFKQCIKKQVSTTRCLSQKVGFMATLKGTGYFINIKGGEKVVYDKVITNVGSAYDPSNGRFTAGTPGLYAFTVVVHTNYIDQNSNFNIKVNDEIATSEFIHNGPTNYHNTGTARAVVQLSKGDHVTVEADDYVDTHTMKQYWNAAININTFSGELIQPDCPQ